MSTHNVPSTEGREVSRDAESGRGVAVIAIPYYRGYCPQCAWHSGEYKDPEDARAVVRAHIGLAHIDGEDGAR